MLYGWRHLGQEDLDCIERGIVTGDVFGGPYHLEIHPTNKCNVDCDFCFTAPYRGAETLDW